MKPRICASITAKTSEEAIRMVEVAESAEADLLELRLDYLRSRVDLSDIVNSTRLPMILTVRRREEGGKFRGNEKTRIQTLLNAADIGFKYVDIELSTKDLAQVIGRLKKTGVNLIISFHNLTCTPNIAEMNRIVERELQAGADVCKLVTLAKAPDDNLACLNLLSNMCRRTKIVCFAAGKLGIISRMLSPLFGAHFTFASVVKGRESAPGQLTVGEMRQLYRLLGVSS